MTAAADAPSTPSPHAPRGKAWRCPPTSPQDLPPALIDAARVGQAAAVLLENALTHTPEGGRITLAARAGVDSIAVGVTDTGVGIPPADLPYVFDRFYRADPSRSRATGGAGLGLTIAKQLIEAHGRTIGAESQESAGSVFTFTLPVAPPRR